MTYEMNSCPTCGSGSPKKIGSEEYDSHVFPLYRCSGCDTEFSALNKYKRTQAVLKKKAEEEAAAEALRQEEARRIAEAEAEARRIAEAEAEARRIAEAARNEAVVQRPTRSGSASDVYKKTIGSTVRVAGQSDDGISYGTGTVISSKGYFVSNAHVVMDISNEDGKISNLCESIYGESGRESYRFDADLIYADPSVDLVLLQTEPEDDLLPVTLATDPVEHGESVYAIGNSKGEGLCIVEGIVSDTRRKLNGNEYIMVSAPVTNGNSGGPLFNADGELIGIVTKGRSDVASMNYAIPIDVLANFLRRAEEQEGLEIF